jgi:hypothetical protein
MSNAVPYFLNLFNSSASERFSLYFDFNRSGDYVNSITGNIANLSGQILPSSTGFWSQSGSGSFSGNYLKVKTTGDVNLTSATYIIVYEKMCNGGATLISTIATGSNASGAYYKGFEFGVTANNYLYFEYYNNKGPQVFSSNIALSDKVSAFLSIDNGTISFGNYDFFKSKLNSVTFPIENNYLFDPQNLYVGYNDSVTNSYSYNKKLTGYVDNLLVFSPSIYTHDLQYINSGMVSYYTPESTYVSYTQSSGITGFITGITGYYTYVTGQELVPTGVINDSFGMQYTGYSVIDLTGTLSGTGIIPVNGVINVPTTGTSGESVFINKDYISTFGKSNFNIMGKLSSGDLVDVSIPSADYPYDAQNSIPMKYDYVGNVFYNSYINQLNSGNSFIVFANGLAQNTGSFLNSGSVYSPNLVILNDYIVNNKNEVIFNKKLGNSDYVSIDVVTGDYNTNLYIKDFMHTGTGRRQIDWPQNYNVFYKGQKLVSGTDVEIGRGAHYGLTASGIYFKNIPLFSTGSGQLFALPKNFNYNITGNKATLNLTRRFFNNYSEVYLNGVRQYASNDYLELAAIDINTGSGIFDIKTGIIYNNNII